MPTSASSSGAKNEAYRQLARTLRPLDGGGQQLTGASTFTWTTFGLRVASTVREFAPSRRLAWEGAGRGSSGYHRWDLQPTPDGGTLLVTEEVQSGIIARFWARY